MAKKFCKVAVGGTFDELHKGHEALIFKAFEISEHVVIGLSSDDFVAKIAKPHITASYSERHRELEAFLGKLDVADKAEIIELTDPYGTAVSDKDLEALVVSKETEPTALKINNKRVQNGLKPLSIITICMVPAENMKPISTTRIRSGEIDRYGHLIKK